MSDRLNAAEGAFLEALAQALPPGTLRAPEARHIEEPRGRYTGTAGAVACPADAAQVAAILRACHAARVGVVPMGGGTGLVGGQTMPEGPVPLILSLERMSAITEVSATENVLIAQAGAVLADVQAAAAGVGRLFPLSLASEGSARIGGLLATNAGGTGVLRWGNMRDLCLGLQVVTADGQIWNGLKRLRKNNMGYDLRHLMIGSEGTLGVITAASLRLVPRPACQGAALLVVDSPADALALLARAQEICGESISAFELISGQGLNFLAQTLPQVRRPYDPAPQWMVLLDLGMGSDPNAAFEAVFDAAPDLIRDGLIAQNAAQRVQLWQMRESIPLANRKIGAVSSHDISLPLSALAEFITRADAIIAASGNLRVNCFGHLGDGNLHYNVFPGPGTTRADHEHLRGAIKTALHDLVQELGGSVSAEHGVGRLKVADLERYGDPVALGMMRALKVALDPAGILNPGAVLRGDPC
jgi:FAD/FMN-containing dehydrogenase